jgi:hypothetical protein
MNHSILHRWIAASLLPVFLSGCSDQFATKAQPVAVYGAGGTAVGAGTGYLLARGSGASVQDQRTAALVGAGIGGLVGLIYGLSKGIAVANEKKARIAQEDTLLGDLERTHRARLVAEQNTREIQRRTMAAQRGVDGLRTRAARGRASSGEVAQQTAVVRARQKELRRCLEEVEGDLSRARTALARERSNPDAAQQQAMGEEIARLERASEELKTAERVLLRSLRQIPEAT